MTGEDGRFVVALDGPAAAGKGTIAKELARRFGFAHLDTGLLYRAVGRKALALGGGLIDAGVATRCAETLRPEDLRMEGLRDAVSGQAASKVAAIPAVREALLCFQRDFAARAGGAVLDGRDIGTVICPDADVKLFVTASDRVRAKRRHEQLTQDGADTTLDEVLADLKRRDARDAAREAAPMKPADDALLLDTTELSINAAVAKAADLIERKRAG